MRYHLHLVALLLCSLLSKSISAQNWKKVQKIVSSNRTEEYDFAIRSNENFGESISSDGSFTAIGTRGGRVFLYESDGTGGWNLLKKIISKGGPQTVSSMVVCLKGDLLAVGDPFATLTDANNNIQTFAGTVYIYSKNQGGLNNWGLVTTLSRSSIEEDDIFGSSLSISGSTLVVGAPADRMNARNFGSIYIYEQNQGGTNNWGLVKHITAGNGIGYGFGKSVCLVSSTLAVGHYFDQADENGLNELTGAGSVSIFYKDQGGADNWGMVKKITSPDRSANDEFGISLTLSGENLIVGAPKENLDASGQNPISEAGAGYLFNKNQGSNDNWGFVKKMLPDTRINAAGFGNAVISENEKFVIGSTIGKAYLYLQNEGGSNQWGLLKVLEDLSVEELKYGPSFAINNTSILAGTPLYNYSSYYGAGSFSVFNQNEGGTDQWGSIHKYNLLEQVPSYDNYGNAIAVDGDYAVVGAYNQNRGHNSSISPLESAGMAYVLKKIGNTWTEIKKLVAPQRVAYDQFGFSVAMKDGVIAIGVPRSDAGMGSVFLFYKDEGGTDNWGFRKVIQSYEVQYGDFGSSIALENNILMVGSPRSANIENNSNNGPEGSVYIYQKDRLGTDNWGLIKKLTAPDYDYNYFGNAINFSQNTLVVGAKNASTDASGANSLQNSGGAYIFYQNEGGTDNWGFVKKIVANDRNSNDIFGSTVSLSNGLIAVGAIGDDEDALGNNNMSNAGSVYLFSQNEGGTNQWGQVKKITPTDRAAGDEFGSSLSLNGTTLSVGSPSKNLDNNNNLGAGSVYVFNQNEGSSNNWGQSKQLTLQNESFMNRSGYALLLNGTNLFVGAPGNYTDLNNVVDGAQSTGAVFLYNNLPSNSWTGGLGNWNVASNWSVGSIPDENSDIIISSGTPTLNTDFSLAAGNNLTLSGTGAMIIAAGKTLTISGNADFGGKSVTLKSTATGTAAIGQITGTLSNATNVTVERYIPATGRRYRLLTPSVTTSTSIRNNWMEGGMNSSIGSNTNPKPGFGVQITGTGGNSNGFDVTATNEASLFSTNNGTSLTYSALTNTSNTLNALTGYFLFIRGDRSMNMTLPNTNIAPNPVALPSSSTTLRATGTLLQGTQSSFTNNFINTSGAMNLVTNPYASPIDWNMVYASSLNIHNYYTFWDPNIGFRGGFVTVNNFGQASAGSANEIIQSGQAFFVTADGNGDVNFTINETHKTSAGATPNAVFGNVNMLSPAPSQLSIELYYKQANGNLQLADGVKAFFSNEFKKQIDGHDALEIANWDENLALVSNGQKLALESRPSIVGFDTITLAISNMKKMDYQLQVNVPEFNNPLLKANLLDKYTKTLTPLTLGASNKLPFSITSDAASASTDRFEIRFYTTITLPIKYKQIQGKLIGSTNVVEWFVEQENNVIKYEIEKSYNGIEFKKIGELSKKINSNQTNSYTWGDPATSGSHYYRVRSVTLDGKEEYSKTIVLRLGKSSSAVQFFPNPIKDGLLTLQFDQMAKGRYKLEWYNAQGQLLKNELFDHNGGFNQFHPTAPSAKGILQWKLTMENLNWKGSLIK